MYESTYVKKNHMNEPEDVRLSEISKSQNRQISYDSAYISYAWVVKIRHRIQDGGCQGWEKGGLGSYYLMSTEF